MIQPRPLTGGASARPSDFPASLARSGPEARASRSLLRLCILSVPARAGAGTEFDWQATADEQRRLAALGFGVAVGLEPLERARLGLGGLSELVLRTGALGLAQGFVAGAACEQIGAAAGIFEQVQGIVEQAAAIEQAGGIPVLLPLPALARRRAREDEYVEVYRTLLARVRGPVIVDWTGPKLRPELHDYFPGKSLERVMALEPAKVRGVRFAQLDVAREARLRRELLARDQLLFTADREHLDRLLLGAIPGTAAVRAPAPERFTELGGLTIALGEFSHALPGDMGADAASLAAALERLVAGDVAGYLKRMP